MISAGKDDYKENGGFECYASVMELKKDTTDKQVLIYNVNHFLKDDGLELWKTDAFIETEDFIIFDIKEADQQ